MISCFILDDEPDCISALAKLLTKYHPEVGIAGQSSIPSEAYEAMRHAAIRPDILFLDIQMPGENGFAFLKRFDEIDFTVIFTTAYDTYAIQAIKCSALDYLLKPIDHAELAAALDRYKSLPHANRQKAETLKTNVHAGEPFSKLAVPALSEIAFVDISEILFLESDNNYTIIHTVQTQIVSSKNIGYFEDLLDGLNFFRIHNSCIINLKKMNRYIRGKPGYVQLENGIRKEVSKRKKEEFLKRLNLV
jgi:two-component system LytT family response regulator